MIFYCHCEHGVAGQFVRQKPSEVIQWRNWIAASAYGLLAMTI